MINGGPYIQFIIFLYKINSYKNIENISTFRIIKSPQSIMEVSLVIGGAPPSTTTTELVFFEGKSYNNFDEKIEL
jgi:hypothetical protein